MPSMMMDGSQIMTQKIVGTVGNAVSQVTPLKTVVDSTGRIMSNVLGSTSRLLGKDVRPEHEMMFLYSRQLTNLGTARQYQNAIKEVIGLALYNVVLHGDEMEGKRYTGVDAATMPVLDRVVKDLQMAGAGQPEIDDIVWLLGRNGKADIPEDMEKQILGVMKDTHGNFRTKGIIEELRWIAQHPHGFYKLNENELNDYKLNTDTLFKSCTVIYPPKFETMEKSNSKVSN